MKGLLGAVMFLGLLAFSASAFALPYAFPAAGQGDPGLQAPVGAGSGPSTGLASFTLLFTGPGAGPSGAGGIPAASSRGEGLCEAVALRLQHSLHGDGPAAAPPRLPSATWLLGSGLLGVLGLKRSRSI